MRAYLLATAGVLLAGCTGPYFYYPQATMPTSQQSGGIIGTDVGVVSYNNGQQAQRSVQSLWEPLTTKHGFAWRLSDASAQNQLDYVLETLESGRTHSWYMRDFSVEFTANSPTFYTGVTGEQCRDGLIKLKTGLGQKGWRSLFCKPDKGKTWAMVVPE
jgi:hypothetical protein